MGLIIKKYSELTDLELKQIVQLILKGNEVNSNTLPARLSEATLIAFFKDEETVVATGTIKKPLDNYKNKIFINSKSNLSINDYTFELGYIMVLEEYRKHKLASQLCKELCELFLTNNIFATTRAENLAMQSILRKNNFTEIGEQYPNRNNTAFLKLLIKN